MAPSQLLLHDYRDYTFIALSTLSTAFALNPTSTLIPGTLALAIYHAYARFLFPGLHAKFKTSLFILGIAAGSAVPNLAASQEALDAKALSFVLLTCLSSLTSAIVVGALFVDWQVSRTYRGSSSLFFPALWATVWRTVAYLSPVGNLLTWGRPSVVGGYKWLVPLVGPASLDWITAAWAVVISTIFQSWFIGPEPAHDDEIDSGHDHAQAPTNRNAPRIATPALALGLGALLVPSFFFNNLPLPVADIATSTPLSVGCILPTFDRYKHHALTLADYINESKKFQNSAKLLLWPEGAVYFASDSERDAAFHQIRQNITGPYVGVSFEQLAADPSDPRGRKGYKRTGIAVLHQDSLEPYLLYHKRHLVPIAESYHLTRSPLPPTIANLSIPAPRGVPPSRWDPSPSHTRSLFITASICLDFALPEPFTDLPSRPGLILAPARTWERSVGMAMWLQAKQRAAELDSMVLWCDGGDGGVSGIGGGGFDEINQVGPGSWVKAIGIQHPFNEKRTIYAWAEDSSVLIYWLLAGSSVIAIPFRRNRERRSPASDPEDVSDRLVEL